MRPPLIRAWSGLIVDEFAGGGGASLGISQAYADAGFDRSPDIAINHDPIAIAMHKANHPKTRHFISNVWKVSPRFVAGGQEVDFIWFSPDCPHHCNAKGGKPVDRRIRGLAWNAVWWAKTVRPRVLMLENVPEFLDWGPLKKGRPDRAKAGKYFRNWVWALRDAGYDVDWRMLRAENYGAATTRKRFFLIARCDGQAIKWPLPTSKPIPAHTVIDWSNPVTSIFGRKKPLAEKTVARIMKGLNKYVFNDGAYIRKESGTSASFMVKFRGTSNVYSLDEPVHTITGQGLHHGVCKVSLGEPISGPSATASFMVKMNGKSNAYPLTDPVHTIMGKEKHALCSVRLHHFLTKYYGSGGAQDLNGPLHTITGKARFGLVRVAERDHLITDIGLRMLSPGELYRAQGFPESYNYKPIFNGRRISKKEQIAKVGNSVVPPVARALVRLNLFGIGKAGDLGPRPEPKSEQYTLFGGSNG